MRVAVVLMAVSAAMLVIPASAWAQQPAPQAPLPYGMPISLALAKKVAAAAETEAKKTGFPSGIVIVGPNSETVFEEKMDNSNNSVIMAAEQKARGAALYRRPSQAFPERLAQAPFIIQLAGVSVGGGGIPLVAKGHIVGAIGVSGAPSSDRDIQAPQAGAAALK
jgi:glc operon protein GlcG